MISIIVGLIILGYLVANPGIALILLWIWAYILIFAVVGAVIVGGLGFLVIYGISLL